MFKRPLASALKFASAFFAAVPLANAALKFASAFFAAVPLANAANQVVPPKIRGKDKHGIRRCSGLMYYGRGLARSLSRAQAGAGYFGKYAWRP